MGGMGISGRLEGLLKAGVMSLAAVLVLLSVSSTKLLSKTRDYLEEELEVRLMGLRADYGTQIDRNISEILKEPRELFELSMRESLVKARLFGQRRQLLADSRFEKGEGEARDPLGITQEEYAKVWDGLTIVSPIYKSKQGLIRSVYFPVRNSDGMMFAVCEISLSAGHIEDLTELGTTYFFLKALMTVFIITVLVYMLRAVSASQRDIVKAARSAGVAKPDSGDNVAFVISSFQAVVSELKAKEKELSLLKDNAEERARFIEKFNESVLNSVQSGVMTFDKDGNMKTMNPAARSILGLSENECESTLDACLGGCNWLGELVTETINNASPKQRGEGEVRTPNGVSRWIGAGTSPLIGDDGVLQGAILVFTDLTEVKQLRERMELKERMTVLGEMSAGIAHELRNPMAVISGYARLLAGKLGENADLSDAVGSIQEEISGMDEIIREFMNFAKPTELNLAEVDITQLLVEASGAVPNIPDAVDVSVEFDEVLPGILGDYVLLRQAFINLIKNAVEAMPRGGKLTLSAEKVESGDVSDVGLALGSYVKVEVADTGEGIPRETMSKIFTPFFSTKGRGTGLGLALVQKILVYHGGRASVKTAEGGGTTFSIYLPAGNTEG